MQRRRLSLVTIVSSVVAVVIVGVLTMGGGTAAAPGGRATTERDAEGAGGEGAGAEGEGEKGGSSEAEEEGQLTQERLDAWRAAKTAGTVRVKPAPAAPPTGWAGEQVISPTADDWEPAIAADPNAPYVYLLSTRYTGPTACGNRCPLPYHVLKVSTDGRRHVGSGPIPVLVPGRQGTVRPGDRGRAEHRGGLRGMDERLQRGLLQVDGPRPDLDDARPRFGHVSWTDKPILAISDDGHRRLRRVQRSDRWRPLRRRRSHNAGGPGPRRRSSTAPVRLRVRWRRAPQWARSYFPRRACCTANAHTAHRPGPRLRVPLHERRRDVEHEPRGYRRDRPELHGRGVSERLLPRAQRDLGGRRRQPGVALRRRECLARQRDDLLAALDRRRRHLVRPPSALDLRGDGRFPLG